MAGEVNNPSSTIPAVSVESAIPSTSAAPARRFRYSSPSAQAAVALASPSDAGAALPLDWQRFWLVSAAALCAFVMLYPSDLTALFNRWSTDSGWSHGFVVPFISLFFIRIKWDTLRHMVPQGSWAGFWVLLLGVVGQIIFRSTGIGHMSELSILVVLFGAVLFIFGWNHLKILWLPIAFLAFSLPPPQQMYDQMTAPLRVVAAHLGVLFLPLFGGEGVVQGTTIDVSFGGKHLAHALDVAEACSGMKMLVAFFALAVALGYSTDRPVWQKLTLAACALPIAILCNAFRVTLTALMAAKLGSAWGEGKAHEYLGILMLGPALVLQMFVAWVLDRLFIDAPEAKVAA